MEITLRLFLPWFVALIFVGSGLAQPVPITPTPITPVPVTPATPTAPEKKAEKLKVNHLTGEVASVDSKAGKLTVKAKDREVSFTVETKAAKSSLKKLKVRDRVKVSYTERDEKLSARSLVKVK